MQKAVRTYFTKFTFLSVILLVVAAFIITWDFPEGVLVFLGAYLISFAFTASNFLVADKANIRDNRRFFKIFGYSFGLRFAGAIVVIILGIKALNSYQIFFTVSFIFSYICHSVIEIIFLNKIFKPDT